jgi:hypothetical protein
VQASADHFAVKVAIPLLSALALASLLPSTVAQDRANPWSPGIHPFIEPQLFSGGDGFGWGFTSAGGLDIERRRFIVNTAGNYGFIRKTNDDDQVPNEHGHTRGVSGEAFLRSGRVFFGPAIEWRETAVTPYRKYAWSPEIGAGRDFGDRDWSMRLQGSYFRAIHEYVDYPTEVAFTPGPGQPSSSYYCECTNGVTGVDIDMWMRSPAASGHVLLHENLQVNRFHETITDPYNLSLTAAEQSQRSMGSTVTAGIVIRY